MTEETIQAPLTNQEIAQSVVKDLPADEIVKEIERLLNENNYHENEAKLARQRATVSNSKYTELYNSVEDFLKEHIKSGDVYIEDLVKFAAQLDIEITKSVKVSFNVVCEYEFTVPLSYDETDFSEHDFDIKISSNISEDDVEQTSESFEVEDFEVEDND
jgi:hypothetical protein